jgi:thiamine biosynthesis protein ThiI
LKYDVIYATFGEVFLKGKNKMAFVRQIVKTLKKKAVHDAPFVSYTFTEDHLFIELNGVDWQIIAEKLDKICGIHSYSLGKTCKSEIEEIRETALAVVKEEIDDKTAIKFETKRGYKQFPMKSLEISQDVAAFVGERTSVKYNIPNPDKIVLITIKPHYTIISAKKIIGLGGLPAGNSGRALLMLSGGIDSPVAAFQLIKRGLVVDCLHFESPPHTSVRAKQKVLDIAEKLAHFLPKERININFVPFTKLQKEIFANVPQNYAMTIMRRMMLRIADKIARNLFLPIIATGESIGQVASQTPQSIYTINAVTNMPVLRPIACNDKQEITEIAKKIGTFDISIRPYEDCCTVFVPPNPATAPKIEKAEKYEQGWNWQDLIDECVENAEVIHITAGNPVILNSETNNEICKLFE